jgi:hypothetical protein
MRIEKPELPEEIVLFGTRILTGPIRYSIPSGYFLDPDSIREFLDNAPAEATMKTKLRCNGPIRLERLTVATPVVDEKGM